MIAHRGDRWYVESEKGKPLGDYATESEANERLRQVEAAKAAKHERSPSSLFDSVRGADGKVREGLWDFVCVDGWDMKENQFTEFTVETLSQMVDNFASRGDFVPYDYNHQTGYTSHNGQPAPALAFATSLAVVWDGQVVKLAHAVNPREVPCAALDATGKQNGLWAYRGEVTDGTADYPLGQQLLPGFRYISPMFSSHGESRHGDDVGYSLIAIACTNTPWQSGTAMAFHTGAAGSTKGDKMRKFARLAAFMKTLGVKFEAGADEDDEKVKAMASEYMEDEAVAAMEEEKFNYEGGADNFEEMAKLYEEAHPEPDGDEPDHVVMRRMAAKFRRMGKMANSSPPKPTLNPDDPAKAPPATPSMEDGPPSEAFQAKMATMEATSRALTAKLERLESAERAREDAIRREKEREYDALADAAVEGGYPKEARGALVKFARTDLEGARASVGHFLPRSGAPAHLFGRVTAQGGPVGGAEARTERGPRRPRRVQAMGRNFIEDDYEFADAIKETAASEDPVVRAKVDRLLSAPRRAVMFDRLTAAEKIVRAERPDLAALAEGE